MNVNQSYGRVFHNFISHSFLPGIHMTEFMRSEIGGAGFQTAVEIRDNVISDACIAYPGRKDWQGAISIATWDAAAVHFVDGHSGITIAGNRIDRPNGIGIRVQCASKIAIEGNVFGMMERVGNAREGKSAPAIYLDEVHGGTVRGNRLAGDGWGAPSQELEVSPCCKDISIELPIRP